MRKDFRMDSHVRRLMVVVHSKHVLINVLAIGFKLPNWDTHKLNRMLHTKRDYHVARQHLLVLGNQWACMIVKIVALALAFSETFLVILHAVFGFAFILTADHQEF